MSDIAIPIKLTTADLMSDDLNLKGFTSGACVQMSLSIVKDNPGTKMVFGNIQAPANDIAPARLIKHCWVELEGKDIVLSFNLYYKDKRYQAYTKADYYKGYEARILRTYSRTEILQLWAKSTMSNVSRQFASILPKKFKNVFKA
jgi:hypothetical protein